MSRVAEQQVPDLFDAPLPRQVEYPPGIPEGICAAFEETALLVRALGFNRYSARAIAHRLRWHEQIEKGNREFKIDNTWTPAIARWLMAKRPELAGFFETRESAADE